MNRFTDIRRTVALAIPTCIGFESMAEAAAPAGPRLYVLDCGYSIPLDPALFGLKAGEFNGDSLEPASDYGIPE